MDERRSHRANPYGDHPESACEWLPLPQSRIELTGSAIPEGDMEDIAVLAAAVLADDREKRGVEAPPAAPASSASSSVSSSPSSSSRPAKRQRVEAPPAGGPGSVAVVVCFRDLHAEQKRGEHLKQFVPYMEKYFAQAVGAGLCTDFKVYIVQQSDDGRKFNRGKLLNIGYDLAKKEGRSVFVFHDVDLLPSPELLPNYCKVPAEGRPVHIAKIWERYNENDDYVGGIVAWNGGDYEAINGFPNNYWGWGGEDDEMMRRCKSKWGKEFRMAAPKAGSITDLEDMALDEKLAFLKGHKDWKVS